MKRSAERWRTSLWLWPVVSAAVALILALVMGRLDGLRFDPERLWIGDDSAARALLQVTATAVITAATLTFSLTVIALQLASQQFSPRLLREFGRDPVMKAVLGILSFTFVFSTSTLYGLREGEPLPSLSIALVLALAIASLIAILAFVTHIVKAIRVDTMMVVVHDETTLAIEKFYPDYHDVSIRSPDELDLDEDDGYMVPARGSGFIRFVEVPALVGLADRADLTIRIEVRAGDHVVRGAPVATVWRAPADHAARQAVAQHIDEALKYGYERTTAQDAGFGVRQLEDIAVKAMSPSINDPVTAAHAVGHMADILVRLVGCRLGATLHADDAGIGRVIVPDRDLRYYLDLASGQLRRFAREEPTVLIALLRMLRDVAIACQDDAQRSEVRRTAAQIVTQLSPTVIAEDEDGVHDLHRRVELALAGEVRAAFADRVGETRSI